jgi:hypothetical protein
MMARATPLAAIFLGLCLSPHAQADAAAPAPPVPREQVQRAVDRSIGYLQTESGNWLNTRRCAACHHAGMPLWALNEADKLGYAIDKKFMADKIEATLGSPDKLIAVKLVPGPKDPPDTRPLARGLNMGLPFLAVAGRSFPTLSEGQKQSLSFITEEILKKQMKDGSWEFFLSRPPINETQLTDVGWILMALQADPASVTSQPQRVALQKGVAWLADTKQPDTYQSKVLKLLLAIRAGKATSDLQPQINELLAAQQPDGGWRQLPEMKSDAFATGQTLYVLSLAGYTAERPQMKRAIAFLVTTQKPDGSWPMTSHASPDGKPGHAKLLTPITCGATSWVTLGLSRAVPKR